MPKINIKKLALLFPVIIFLASIPFWSRAFTFATPSAPNIDVSFVNQNSDSIHVSFSSPIPNGDMVDIEVLDGNNNKAAQNFTDSGGTDFNMTASNLNNGTYSISVGLFTPNWANNYAWFDKIKTITLPNSSAVQTNTNGAPSVSVNQTSSGVYNISATFSTPVPKGNIIDLEVHDPNNNKVWQSSTANGGNSYSVVTSPLSDGNYTVSVGLFSQNWSNNYAWFDKVAAITVGANPATPTPSIPVTPMPAMNSSPASTPVPINTSLSSTAMSLYSNWKSNYVKPFGGALRVVRPDNNNDTVSEGIGYGMLAAALAQDRPTFDGLWNYGQKYLDSKGLMNWQIDSNGNIIGLGSATDADEDMAYGLVLANKIWPGAGYDAGAGKLISAMEKYDVLSNNYVNPGDNWGNTPIMNPSYIAPSYYRAFANFTGDSRWNTIANQNSDWLVKVADPNTGLLPDWKNADGSDANISFDAHKNDFYYDASRTPIRLLLAHLQNNDVNAQMLLTKQANFLGKVGVNSLTSGYTLSGSPVSNYLDTTFLTSYVAAGQINPSSDYAKNSINVLVSKNGGGYFGDSLRVLLMLFLSQPQ